MSVNHLIVSKYGEPDEAYQAKYCTMWLVCIDFPWAINIINSATGKPLQRIFINRDFKDKLAVAFKVLEANNVHREIKTFDGCFNVRSVRGKDSTSLHAWAMAVDLNAATEKLAQENTHWSGQFIAIMKAAGLFWGGDWQSRHDSMHFSLWNG